MFALSKCTFMISMPSDETVPQTLNKQTADASVSSIDIYEKQIAQVLCAATTVVPSQGIFVAATISTNKANEAGSLYH